MKKNLRTLVVIKNLHLTGRKLSDAGCLFIDWSDGELMMLAELGLGVPRGELIR